MASLVVLFSGIISVNFANAQEITGGVDKPGSWYVGEGLKQGDYFSYKMCHVYYRECQEFEIDFWISGERQVGSESKWVAQTVVYDGNKIVKGEMELGKFVPEPTGGSEQLSPYRSAFKSSIAWLSAFATAPEAGSLTGTGPKEFKALSWGKIGNIGGQQVRPYMLDTVTTPAGKFDAVIVSWYTGGYRSNIWVVDELAFPVKALTYTQVPEGIPPLEYKFEILDHKTGVTNDPFKDVQSTAVLGADSKCPKNYDQTTIKRPTKNFNYIIEIKYGPDKPTKGCPIEWFINFKNRYNEKEFLNQVQYDIFVVDDKLTLPPIRTIAGDDGRDFLYTPSGQVYMKTLVKEPPGNAHYVIWIYGLAPEGIVPATQSDYLLFDIPIAGDTSGTTKPADKPTEIPAWIKNNAGWWSGGQIDDSSFVQGIQYLIKEGIIKIPQTSQGSSSGTNQIPAWIKTNAGWWADGQIDDNAFVQGIQWLITNGIMKIS